MIQFTYKVYDNTQTLVETDNLNYYLSEDSVLDFYSYTAQSASRNVVRHAPVMGAGAGAAPGRYLKGCNVCVAPLPSLAVNSAGGAAFSTQASSAPCQFTCVGASPPPQWSMPGTTYKR